MSWVSRVVYTYAVRGVRDVAGQVKQHNATQKEMQSRIVVTIRRCIALRCCTVGYNMHVLEAKLMSDIPEHYKQPRAVIMESNHTMLYYLSLGTLHFWTNALD